ncbi:UspA [Sesbania bispinosa]|nr:UspA [Sesbania bispinosa]
MKLIGDSGGGRKVLVGVKLDPRSRELLTWALVKVAEPGDLVIALHSVDFGAEGTASLLSLVKTFDSVLAVYEGFCHLKQAKVCRGGSPRKLLVQEAKSFGVATVILGTSKSHHPIRSSVSVAKYCAKKLPKCVSVFAVDNGKIAFHREAATICSDQEKLHEGPNLSSKSLVAFATNKRMKNCESCAWQETCETESKEGFPDDLEKENPLALVPFQKLDDAPCYSIVVGNSKQSKPGWSLLRQPNCHSSAVVHPDQKQINIDQNDDSTLDGVSGAIVPFGSTTVFPPPSFCSDSNSLPEELMVLQEKYSSSCRIYGLQELVSATANFSPENLVGKGGSSDVYRGCLPDGKELAVKILKPSENVLKSLFRKLRGSLEENLHGNKKDCNAFGWRERYQVAVAVAEALDHLHNGCAQAVIHKDVKSSNILLSDEFEAQLSDFGLASWGSSSSHITCTDVAGTFGYLAPEYFMHGRVTDKIDVYAFGVVLLELLSNRKPINNECPKGAESLVMWATPILKDGKLSQLLDPSLGSEYDHSQIKRMVLAATLCIRRAPRLRPQISLILKLLRGVEEVTRWAELEASAPEELDGFDEEPVPTNIQSHLNLALLDLEDDAVSISSTEQSVSLEDYLQGRWSRSSSFD